jgi:hypothetical protein
VKKLPRHKLYGDAETLFVEQGLTCKAICETLNRKISEISLSKWRSDYEWDSKREEFISSPYKIREILMRELSNIAAGGEPTIKADSLLKIQKVFASFEKSSTSIPVVISVFKEFDNWMTENDPELAVKFTDFHKKYLHHLAQLKSE